MIVGSATRRRSRIGRGDVVGVEVPHGAAITVVDGDGVG